MGEVKATKVVTDKVRLSYVHLFTPQARNAGEDPKYSCTVLIPKSDTATKARIDAAIEAAKQEGMQNKFGGVVPPILPTPVHDGDGPRPSDGLPYGEECKGHWVINVSSKQAPQVVDVNRNPILDQSEIYSGIYGRVSMNFYAYNNNKKGIGCGLNNVQKLADGEPLGGRSSAEEDFGPAPGAMAPATPAYQPQPVQQPMGQPQAPAFDPITGMPLTPGV